MFQSCIKKNKTISIIFKYTLKIASIWGNIISASILKPKTENINSTITLICGAYDCPGNPGVDSKKPLLKTVSISKKRQKNFS
jgi:hypothetical protein